RRRRCGNGTCDGTETCSSCPADCGTCPPPPACGDGVCDSTETCSSCDIDCGTCVVASCGDGSCSSGETCASCPSDCGTCPTTQTRLGLHVTQEELNIWKQRATSGPYRTAEDVSPNSPGDWERIQGYASAFLSSPSSETWSGQPAGSCWSWLSNPPALPGR